MCIYIYVCVYVCVCVCVSVCVIYMYVCIWMNSNSVKSVVPITHSGFKVIFTVECKVFNFNINVTNEIEFGIDFLL